MGEVYRARDTRLAREVAVKILPEHLADNAEALHRFEREAKAVAALSHPNILAIHDFGNEQGVSYAVMELLEGETLRERLMRSPMDWREAIGVATAVAEGLAAAHAKGIVHRDLKPENIFLTSSGGLKILDFGIARVKQIVWANPETLTSPETTRPGTIMGTIGYMSPEQVRGETADAPSDIFSLGCMLYEMVSGRRAFAHTTAAETIAAILKDEPPAVLESGEEIPNGLERLIRSCLEKQSSARPQLARDLAEDLKAIAGGRGSQDILTARRRPRWHLPAMIGAAAVILSLSVPAWLSWAARQDQTIDSLAVLPLNNTSVDGNIEYLSDGITEAIINSLSQLPQLKRVIARSTVSSYKGKEVDPRRVGQELNVKAVLTGKMIQRGDDLIIGVELVKAQDGSHLWGERYSRKMADVIVIQTDIALRISDKLRLALTSEQQRRLTKYSTENPEAYKLYLRGRHHLTSWSKESFTEALALFKQAIDLDPNYALAWTGLADAYYSMSNLYWPPHEAMPKSRAAAENALSLDETLAEAHYALATVKAFYDWDWLAAESEFNRAMELNPGYKPVHPIYGAFLMFTGKTEGALTELKRLRELDPLSLSTAVTAVNPLFFAPPSSRQYDRAIVELQKIIALDPQFPPAHHMLGLAYEQNRMFSDAIAEFEKAWQLDKAPYILGPLGHAYAVAGRRAEAQKILDELQHKARRENAPNTPALSIAQLYVGLGDKDKTFEWLEIGIQRKDEEMPQLGVDPRFDGLRSEPRFMDLLRRMNLAP
jgi:serine/threonine-protein kinase